MIKQKNQEREEDKNMPTNLFKLFVLGVFIIVLNGCCKNCDACVGCNDELEKADQELTDDFVHNLIVENGSQFKGLPFEEKGNMSLNVSAKRSFGLFDEGFDFKIESDKNISGIQLRVKRGDAISKEYVDIKFSEESTTIEVDTDLRAEFGDGTNFGVSIGTICYEVRSYNLAGNISTPQEICFDIIGWGNDGAIARAWELQYYEENLNGKVLTRNIDEVYCDDGQDKPCFSLNNKFFTLKDNGTFLHQSLSYEYENGDSDSDYDRYEESFEGKWVYIENRLHLVVYSNSLFKNENAVRDSKMKLGEGSILEFYEVTLDDDFQPLNMNMMVNQPDKDGKQKKIIEYYSRPRDL